VSKDYRKKCDRCGADIIMSLSDATGKWQPMNPDNSIHRCMVTMVQTPQNGKVVTANNPSSSPLPPSLVSLTQDEIKILKDIAAKPVILFNDEELRCLREVIQVFQEFKKK